MEAALFPLRLFAEVAYYAAMWHTPVVAFDTMARYDKADKDTHRFAIADAAGRLCLTVPVHRLPGAGTWADVLVSDHGRWWETMPTALESAYGRTPFFEFYIDRLRPLFTPEPIAVTELCRRADTAVRGILDLHPRIVDADELQYSAHYKPAQELPPYWQVRQHTHGFIPGLSILDLIFNLGPEARLYLNADYSATDN